MTVDVVVIGGGPAGAAAARLLASWDHRVLLVARCADRSRGLAESLPPSTHKLLHEVGVLDDINEAAFYRSTGNTVWWASREPRVESFGSALGYQVFRPDLDRVLIDSAARAGVEVREGRVRAVRFADDSTSVDYVLSTDRQLSTVNCQLVVDASGRTGVIGRRFRRAQPEFRTCALVGVWERERWDLPDRSHTTVETFDRGWTWSVPISETVRHVGLMIDGGSSYDAALAETFAMRRLVNDATRLRTFACDASLYCADQYAGPQFLLVGDSGSFIDPLSSFGVKKALASAWVGAIVANTMLARPERRHAAIGFFNDWERRVYAEHLRRSRDFARRAFDAHPSSFWKTRADVAVEEDVGDQEMRAALERIKSAASVRFALAADVGVEPRPVIRGREIVLEEAFVVRGLKACTTNGVVRFHNDVDLVALAGIACQHSRVPDVFEEYCRRHAPAPLPNVITGLSLLVAKRILTLHESRA